MLYAFPSFNHLGALDICVVYWDLIPLERNPVNALIIVTNNLIALLNLYEIIFVCIKSSLYEPCTDGGLKYNLSHLFHPQKNKFPFSCQ